MGELLGSVTPAALNGIGVVALVVLFAVAVTRGWLVTGSAHTEAMNAKDTEFDRMVTLKDGTIERLKGEKDDWRDAYRASDARGDVQSDLLKDVVTELRAFNRFMEALRSVVDRGGST